MGKYTAHVKLTAAQSKESIASLTSKGKITRNRTTKKQKQLDSMQPSDELAAIFGMPPKPSFTRNKL